MLARCTAAAAARVAATLGRTGCMRHAATAAAAASPSPASGGLHLLQASSAAAATPFTRACTTHRLLGQQLRHRAGMASSGAAAHQPGGAKTEEDVAAARSRKQQLRQEVKQQLKALSPDSMRQQSSAIAQHVVQSAFFQGARSVGLYITCERLREVDTMALLQHAMQAGKHVFVPLVEDKASNMSLLHIDTLADLQPAPPFGILEPSRQHPDGSPRVEVLAAPYQLDLLLMPGLAFDSTGGRLGRGGGYYDKLVHALDGRAQQQGWHRPWLVALAFHEQLVGSALPMAQHDRHVDVLATPEGLVLCSDRARSHSSGAGQHEAA